MENSFLLSVCIPTYNRGNQVKALTKKILAISPDVEVCVHVDGSTDDTLNEMKELEKTTPNVRVTSSENQGRAHALLHSIKMASASFVMLYDDDDDIYTENCRSLLTELRELPSDLCGVICHMCDESGSRLGTAFPENRSNFFKLRYDQEVLGDKKEIVRTELLKSVLYEVSPDIRRAPTSILWNRLALQYDVLCRDIILGTKRYMPDGYTKSIARLKRANPDPMREVNLLRIRGYLKGRYSSLRPAIRSLVAWGVYSARASWQRAGRR